MNRLLPGVSVTACVGLGIALAGCTGRTHSDHASIVVFNAGALALPLRQALDSFTLRNHLTASQENAGSLETIRKITDLGRVPDVVALADTALFSRLLQGRLAGPVAVLGHTRLVLAYTDRSRFASEINAQNWTEVTTRPAVQVGRSDPALDPAGYRALMAMQLAERHYARPGLAQRLEAAAGTSNMRPKSADLIALLQTGNLDYAWEYESVARSVGLRFISLPSEVDLGDPSLAAFYATAKVRIPSPGRSSASGKPDESGTQQHAPLVMSGGPIVFGAAVPRGAPHLAIADHFITYLMSPEGSRIFSAYGLRKASGPAGAQTR